MKPYTKVRELKTGAIYTVLGPEDYEGYKRNKPGDGWELTTHEQLGRIWRPVHNKEFYAVLRDDSDPQS